MPEGPEEALQDVWEHRSCSSRPLLCCPQVDWLGQKAQVDAARSAGIKKVVVVSSMGGTDKDNNLNKLGDNGEQAVQARAHISFYAETSRPFRVQVYV